jgi:hypothetical protein
MQSGSAACLRGFPVIAYLFFAVHLKKVYSRVLFMQDCTLVSSNISLRTDSYKQAL